MMRAWIAVALLAGGWLFGLDYYLLANVWVWAAMVAAAVLLLAEAEPRQSEANQQADKAKPQAAVAVALLLPVVWLVAWPYRMGPLLLLVGVVLAAVPIPSRWPKALGRGAAAAGAVLLAQAVAITAYAAHTARSHDAPAWLALAVSGLARALGIDAAAEGSTLAVHGSGQVHRLAVTWDMLLDPATVCFLAGGIAMLALAIRARQPAGSRWTAWIAALRALALVTLAWIPVRAALLVAMYLHRAARWDWDMPLYVMNQFFSPWLLSLLVAPAVLLAWRFVKVDGEGATGGLSASAVKAADKRSARGTLSSAPLPALTLLLVAAGVLAMAADWDPVGWRKQGRVKFVERHSTWSPTTRPYDTKWFGHDSCYNYAAAYKYLSQFYEMSRLLETDRFDEAALADCDVLVIKIPSTRYAPGEVEAVVEFVRRGGGLLMIGDHTNYDNSSTIMNDIARQFGFAYRTDLVSSAEESPYDQPYRAPRVPHPMVQHVRRMDFAGSCSIDPGGAGGRAALAESRLWSMPSDYHPDNYFPFPRHCPEMRFGPFVQLWAMPFERGRVAAFTDSTIFSNFAVFQPGKAELLRDMIEWLNHSRPPVHPRPWLAIVGGLALAGGLWLAWAGRMTWVAAVAAISCGWVLGGEATAAVHRRAMPEPPVARRLPQVVIDRTTSDVLLAKGAFIQGEGSALGKGYGMLEMWIPRLGYVTARREDAAALTGDALVVICPNRSVPEAFRDAVARYVADGGRLLVLDSPENAGSTANSLLAPFGMSIDHGVTRRGMLEIAEDGWTPLEVRASCQVAGGRRLAEVRGATVAAETRHGKGLVMALGFASLVNDEGMGLNWELEPNAAVKSRYDLLFALLARLVENAPLAPPGKK